MRRHCLALGILVLVTTLSYAQPSLPSSFQAKTIHSPEGADIYVRWGGTGAVVLLLMDMPKTATRGLHWQPT
jgi:hypothetical protein